MKCFLVVNISFLQIHWLNTLKRCSGVEKVTFVYRRRSQNGNTYVNVSSLAFPALFLMFLKLYNDRNSSEKMIFPKNLFSHYPANLIVVRYQYTTIQINKNTFEKKINKKV